MKILYLLFALLFLAFLSEPGNAQDLCHNLGGRCFRNRCSWSLRNHGGQDCPWGSVCCKP
uniref:Beta-defensin-like protein n=1 Tax=Mesotes strigatus TaxID=3148976 RepID=H2FLD8_9SAUR|nr:crotamine-like precursor [Thamnodynastes strigatus]AEY69049.1 crotamine-like precursor [Thamnodynastes strigatus]APZ74619.1 beta-defensin-like protein [Thamnodynastes strigatus]APZ74621.1 beta-defensin-like protein [Thamnodynastes strigatus]APZ74622.1 beta-defensin-like protein [Thamnodynastes strigatus]